MVDRLMKLGFTNKEAKVYLTLLEAIEASAQTLSKNSGLNRSTTYVILEGLIQKGLVSSIEKNGVKLFQSTPPEQLLSFLQERSKQYQDLVGFAHQLLPELKAVFKGVGAKPKIQFFEGEDGIKTVYEETLTSTETIRAFASIDDMHATLPEYFPEYYYRRAGRGIHIRAIFPDTEKTRERIKFNNQESRTAHLIPSDRFAFTPEINIYDNKLIFMSLKERFALVIQSAEIADAMKKIFELAWAESERLNNQLDDTI